MINNNDRILITGGCGFVGTNLIADLLLDGHDPKCICVVDNLTSGKYDEKVHEDVIFHHVDIRMHYAITEIFTEFKPKYVFHFAGLVSIYDCDKFPVPCYENNIMGSLSIFNHCIKYDVEHTIFAETSAVYEGCDIPADGFHEAQSDPVTTYATSKASVALLAKAFSKTKGFKYTALRYFNIAGPCQDFKRTVPPLFAGVILRYLGNNQPIIFGDGERRRDFIHVDDVNAFHKLILGNKDAFCETYNLGLGKSMSLLEIVEIIKEIVGSDIEGVTYMEEINGEAFNIFANIDAAKKLGWEPKKSIIDAITDTYQYLSYNVSKSKIDPETFMQNLDIKEIKI